MKTIVKLDIRDWLGIRAVSLTPGKVTTLAGENRNGKTSILKAIRQGLEGGGIDPSCIREGADKAGLDIGLSDGVQITRSVTAKGSYLKVRDAAGEPLPKAQAVLDQLTGAFAFNPIEFLKTDGKKQRSYLLGAVKVELPDDAIDIADPPGLDEHALDYCRRRSTSLETERRELGRKGATAKAAVDLAAAAVAKLPEVVDAPQLVLAQEQLQAAREERARARAAAEAWDKAQAQGAKRHEELQRLLDERTEAGDGASVETARSSLARAEAEVTKLREHLRIAEHVVATRRDDLSVCERAEARRLQRETRIAELEQDTAEQGERADTAAAEQAVTVAESDVTKAQQAEQRRLAEEAHDRARAERAELEAGWAALTEQLNRYRKDLPEQLVAAASAELRGLDVTDDGLRWQGRPIDHCSTSEQIGIALRIVQLLSGELGVICVDGIEALDDDRRAAFYAAIEADPYQYFVTRATKSPELGELVVRDGAIVQ